MNSCPKILAAIAGTFLSLVTITLGLLAFGALGTGLALKGKLKQNGLTYTI